MYQTHHSGPIGVFDSGVGGLTVARAIHAKMPQEDIIYFGDTLHLPYGEKSSDAIKRYSLAITKFLMEQNAKTIVVACNSASANAYQTLVETFPNVEIINVIDPVTKYCELKGFSSIGVIGTKATIGSATYQRILSANLNQPKVIAKATPLLASMIEEGFINGPVAQSVLNAYLQNDPVGQTEAFILGCTHYPLLEDEIKPLLHPNNHIVNTPKIVAEWIHASLQQKELLAKNESRTGKTRFYLSDLTQSFVKQAELFFGEKLDINEVRLPD